MTTASIKGNLSRIISHELTRNLHAHCNELQQIATKSNADSNTKLSVGMR